jgi:two-component system, LytTR family, response regulator
MIRTLIVDDEPPARSILRAHLAGEPDVEIVGEAEDGASAVARIKSLEPDLVFLDVQMPGMDGFDVVRAVAPVHLPVVVFVTAHDRFALQAFEVHALDYLLKPFSAERFQENIVRARAELGRSDDRTSPARIAELLDDRPGASPALEDEQGMIRRFVVRDRNRFLILAADEVDWIESAGNYASLRARGRRFLIRETMNDLARRLDPAKFARIHRQSIVHLDRIGEVRTDEQGGYEAVMQNGDVLPIGRHYRDALLPRR